MFVQAVVYASRYFECDEDSDDYNSDDSDYTPRYVPQVEEPEDHSYEDDEVFVDSVPGDNTSTDLLLDKEKMSISSEEPEESEEERNLNLEVAAGTPVLLNYLLTHPITCTIQ
ncbi:hypothetical protein O3G_MSEX015057 [Manduca sexta]|uniref:Uncharacterized protein n=1 Tax=Manduca sexta TaxID=7130 RepID=A0A922D1H3_MANSE|nr:hypothetical protein O3G_MSEX015057 [Manduca sexta]